MNDMTKMGLTLMMITLVSGIALALTNQFTEKQIGYNNELNLKRALAKVYPAAKRFDRNEDYYDAYDENNKIIGKILSIEAAGYSSTIKCLVGVDSQDTIMGISILEQQETPGLGANIAKDDFLNQFIGRKKEGLTLKKDGGDIDAVTGATISSRAVVDSLKNCDCEDAVTSAAETYEEEAVENETKWEDLTLEEKIARRIKEVEEGKFDEEPKEKGKTWAEVEEEKNDEIERLMQIISENKQNESETSD